MKAEDAVETNRSWWDERAAFHLDTPLYRKHLARLESGGLSLLPLETRELGDIAGLRVLHLQCHIGTDSLSLARLGASVTGVDYSEVAISQARSLSERLQIPAEFHRYEISEISGSFPEAFDLVFTSHGFLSWLPDLSLWARQIAACLRPDGHLYLCESHPLVWALAEEEACTSDGLRLGLPYLAQPRPDRFEESGSYADRARVTRNDTTYEWSWSIGDVVNALVSAGLQILWLREHPVGFCPSIPQMSESSDGHYRLPTGLDGRYPLTFSIRAVKRG